MHCTTQCNIQCTIQRIAVRYSKTVMLYMINKHITKMDDMPTMNG